MCTATFDVWLGSLSPIFLQVMSADLPFLQKNPLAWSSQDPPYTRHFPLVIVYPLTLSLFLGCEAHLSALYLELSPVLYKGISSLLEAS